MNPLVGLVMGSDSDWPVMGEAAAALEEFDLPFEAKVVSAHRRPTEMIAYGEQAEQRGIRVIIAGAGGAAHLPGMLAAVTPLPVVGVPVPLAYLDGMDSLLSIVQMPAGVPVATVSIGGARNAGLAARILGAGEGDRGETTRPDDRVPTRAPRDRPPQGRTPGRAALAVIRRLIDVVARDRTIGDAAEEPRGILLRDEDSRADPAGLVVCGGYRRGAAYAVGAGSVAEGKGEPAEVDDIRVVVDGEGAHARVHELQLPGGVE